MNEPLIKPCLATFHPFKQKTYKYHGWEGESPNYCSSCYSYYNFMLNVLTAMSFPKETLYGNSMIELTREEMHSIVDVVYDKKEKL